MKNVCAEKKADGEGKERERKAGKERNERDEQRGLLDL